MHKLVFAAVAALAVAFPAPGQNDRRIEARVDELVRPYQEVGAFSGSILIARAGRVLVSKGYGMANYELGVSNTPQTRFHIASLSKSFTAAAVLLLEERGKLAVSDPLARFIPDYPNGNRITLHHLLTHHSGIPNANSLPEYDAKSKFPQSLAQIIGMFKHLPLEFEPGARSSYSNSNYNLLAYIIEQASGETYGDFLARHILQPLGMHDTGHDGDAAALVKNSAAGYLPAGMGADGRWQVAKAPWLDWTIKTGNGSLYSTVEDLYKWDRALYTEKLLKKATLEKMFSAPYGWFTGKRLRRRLVRYNGRSPGFVSALTRYVDDDTCVIVTANNYSALGQELEVPLAAIVFGEKHDSPLPRPVSPGTALLDPLVGHYQFGAEYFVPNMKTEIVRRGNQLFSVALGSSSPLMPVSETEFFHLLYGGRIIFEKNEQGQFTRLVFRAGRDFPAPRIRPQ